jgi:hypothetical protein
VDVIRSGLHFRKSIIDTDRRRHAAEAPTGTGLGEAEDIVDEKQHVLAFRVAECWRRSAPTADADGRPATRHLAVTSAARGSSHSDNDAALEFHPQSLPSRVRSPTPQAPTRRRASWRCC